jgi:hypothetical protein
VIEASHTALWAADRWERYLGDPLACCVKDASMIGDESEGRRSQRAQT